MHINPKAAQDLSSLFIDPRAAKAEPPIKPELLPTRAAALSAASKKDVVELSASSINPKQPAPNASAAPVNPAQDAQNTPPVAQASPDAGAILPEPAQPAAPNADTTPTVFTQADLDALLASYGFTSKQEGFDARLDLNNDGVIDFQDLSEHLKNFQAQPPAPTVFTQADLQGLMSAYGATAGQENFNSAWDLNNDGVIDFEDLSAMLSNFETPLAQNAATQLDGLLNAFGSAKGDANYNELFDFTGTGNIGFDDLRALLSTLCASEGPARSRSASPTMNNARSPAGPGVSRCSMTTAEHAPRGVTRFSDGPRPAHPRAWAG